MVLLYHEHISNVQLLGHNALKKRPKNLPKTLPKRGPNPSKIDAENVLFFNIDFLRFRLRFWRVLGLQVRRAACSARRVKPHCIFSFENPAWKGFRGGQSAPKSESRLPHVGTMLGPCWLIFRSWASFFRSWTPLARLVRVFSSCSTFFLAFRVAPDRIFGHSGTI